MIPFMDSNFLLNTETARILFREAADLPIIDYHCHISPKEIWEDKQYDNITQVWLGGDHYKWRLMRCAGIDEKYITGDATDFEKFMKWADVLGHAAGNPLYHWSHLELQRYFNIKTPLNLRTAEEIWYLTKELLQKPEFSVRNLIQNSHVETICTTDDPTDTLEWHEKIAADGSFHTSVYPAWRPDKALTVTRNDYTEYIHILEKESGIRIDSFEKLCNALRIRMDFFDKHGCRLSDHGLNYVCWEPASNDQINSIFQKRMSGNNITEKESEQFLTACMLFLAAEYKHRNWVMQIHFGCLRNTNPVMMNKLGPDSGYDMIGDSGKVDQLAAFMGALEKQGNLPKTILYSLNPSDNQMLDTLCGCFQNSEAVCKIQHGSAWWFNDSFKGMTEQLESFANLGYLNGFVGMLTDSRSFLSYPRHEYFRRILCRLLGQWTEQGFFPDDLETLKEIVYNICYGNAKEYFGFGQI